MACGLWYRPSTIACRSSALTCCAGSGAGACGTSGGMPAAACCSAGAGSCGGVGAGSSGAVGAVAGASGGAAGAPVGSPGSAIGAGGTTGAVVSAPASALASVVAGFAVVFLAAVVFLTAVFFAAGGFFAAGVFWGAAFFAAVVRAAVFFAGAFITGSVPAVSARTVFSLTAACSSSLPATCSVPGRSPRSSVVIVSPSSGWAWGARSGGAGASVPAGQPGQRVQRDHEPVRPVACLVDALVHGFVRLERPEEWRVTARVEPAGGRVAGAEGAAGAYRPLLRPVDPLRVVGLLHQHVTGRVDQPAQHPGDVPQGSVQLKVLGQRPGRFPLEVQHDPARGGAQDLTEVQIAVHPLAHHRLPALGDRRVHLP